MAAKALVLLPALISGVVGQVHRGYPDPQVFNHSTAVCANLAGGRWFPTHDNIARIQYKKIDTNPHYGCALTYDNWLDCWAEPGGVEKSIRMPEQAKDFYLSAMETCIIALAGGGVKCYNGFDDEFPQSYNYNGAGTWTAFEDVNVTGMAVAQFYDQDQELCVLNETGSVICMSEGTGTITTPLPSVTGATKIVGNAFFFCVQQGSPGPVSCFSHNSPRGDWSFELPENVVAYDMDTWAWGSFCILNETRMVECWNDWATRPGRAVALDIDNSGAPYTALAVGSQHVCAIKENAADGDNLICWLKENSRRFAPWDVRGVTAVGAGGSALCLIAESFVTTTMTTSTVTTTTATTTMTMTTATATTSTATSSTRTSSTLTTVTSSTTTSTLTRTGSSTSSTTGTSTTTSSTTSTGSTSSTTTTKTSTASTLTTSTTSSKTWTASTVSSSTTTTETWTATTVTSSTTTTKTSSTTSTKTSSTTSSKTSSTTSSKTSTTLTTTSSVTRTAAATSTERAVTSAPTPPQNGPAPAPADGTHVKITMTFQGLMCGDVMANATLVNEIQNSIKDGILAGMGNGKFTRSHIQTRLFCPSAGRRLQQQAAVLSESIIDPAGAGVTPQQLLQSVETTAASMRAAVQQRVLQVKGIDKVTMPGAGMALSTQTDLVFLPTTTVQTMTVVQTTRACGSDICVTLGENELSQAATHSLWMLALACLGMHVC